MPPTATRRATVRIDPDSRHNRINRGLFGANAEWAHFNEDVLWENGQMRESVIETARRSGVSSLRYPGGMLGDYFEWHLAQDPLPSRPEQFSPFSKVNAPVKFGPQEFYEHCAAIGATPWLQTNPDKAGAEIT